MTTFWTKFRLWWEGYCSIHLSPYRYGNLGLTRHCLACRGERIVRRQQRWDAKNQARMRRIAELRDRADQLHSVRGNAERTAR